MSRIQIQAAGAVESSAETKQPTRPMVWDRAKVEKSRTERLARLRAMMPAYWFRHIETTPPLYIGARIKAALGEASPRLAIKAKCEECVGYEQVKDRVGGCKSSSCPLWAYRPHRGKSASQLEVDEV